MQFGAFDKLRLIHRAWRYRRRSESGPMRFVLGHVKPGQIVLDIGANKGAYTYWMCRLVGPGGRVIAFEPQLKWADYIESAGRAFGFEQLSVVPAGLSSKAGNRDLYMPHDNPSGGASFERDTVSSGEKVTVTTCVLDELLTTERAHPVRLIKCDVEGHEYEIFRGALRTLTEDRPILLFECQDYRHPDGQIARVFGLLEDLGYAGRFFDPSDKLRPIDEFDVLIHQAELGSTYCDNFVFAHSVSMNEPPA